MYIYPVLSGASARFRFTDQLFKKSLEINTPCKNVVADQDTSHSHLVYDKVSEVDSEEKSTALYTDYRYSPFKVPHGVY